MTSWSSVGPTVLASFLASLVEFVEALTIVLAVGLTRGWPSSLLGTAAGVAALVALVAVLGPSLQAIPLAQLQLAVGLLLLLFGMRWLHKAVLREAGVIALRDEALEFSKRTRALHPGARAGGLDGVGVLTAFKAVLLEGVEVVFVVVALGLKGGMLLPASAGALLALLLVALLGLLLHRPLARVPENTLKFSVGVMLTAFGTYWAGEGLGLEWPASDATVLLLIAGFLAAGWLLAKACARLRLARPAMPARSIPPPSVPGGGLLPAIGSELLGLFVDDLWLASVLAGWVVLSAALLWLEPGLAGPACLLFPIGLAGVLASSACRRTLAAPACRS